MSYKPISKQKCIVRIDAEEKTYTQVSGLRLYLTPQASEDSRWSNPTTAILQEDEQFDNQTVPSGAYLLIHHNAIMSSQQLEENVYLIGKQLVFGYISSNGQLHPLYPYAFGKRMFHMERSSPIYIPETKMKNHIYLTHVPENDLGVEAGKAYVMYEKSDYNCICKVNGKIKIIVKVNMDVDLLGIDHEATQKIENGEIILKDE